MKAVALINHPICWRLAGLPSRAVLLAHEQTELVVLRLAPNQHSDSMLHRINMFWYSAMSLG